MIEIPVSIGELIDKITILELKAKFFSSKEKKANAELELSLLLEKLDSIKTDGVQHLIAGLRETNTRLWNIESELRKIEAQGLFDDNFISLARSVYIENDRRAKLKRQINTALGSTIVEEKEYK
jgi:hypothetical protein